MSKRACRITAGVMLVLAGGVWPAEASQEGRRSIAAQRRVAAGSSHTCVVRDDAGVECWGLNASGQLGDGTVTNRTSPRRVSLSQALTIAAGAIHTCAITSNGGFQAGFDVSEVRCWGENSAGQIGNGTTVNASSPRFLTFSGATGLALGIDHTCAMLETGSVRCWGDNTSGQLGTGNTTAQIRATTAINVSGLSDAVAIAAGLFHTCAVRVNGRVVCWGQNDAGQLGNNTRDNQLAPVQVANLDQAVDVVAGATHTCAVRANGTVRCWGRNAEGQLGSGSFEDSLQAVSVSSLDNVKALAAGWFHNCAVRADATTLCWGINDSGQLGDGTSVNREQPVPVENLPVDVLALSAGNVHTCVVRANGSMGCWGLNDSGQLGGGDAPGAEIDPGIRGTDSATALDAGAQHSCAVRGRGTVACWGSNGAGQINGTASPASTPSPTGFPLASFPGTENVVSVVAGAAHSCALHVAGTVTCWGTDSRGQAGRGSTGGLREPDERVVGLDQVVALSAGESFTCALRAAGDVQCWGAGDSGQLGNGTVDSATTVTVTGLSNVVAITSGARHACAIRANGTVRCWGENIDGQLGNNSTSATPTPDAVAVNNLGNARAIAAGGHHTCAIRVTGAIHCWGRNSEGQLGTGTTTQSSVPIAVASQLRVDSRTTIQGTLIATLIAVGDSHSCAQSGTRTICWGRNDRGQTGFPGTANQTIPVLVPRPSVEISSLGRSTLAVGTTHSCARRPSGAVVCWGDGTSGMIGGASTTNVPQTVSSFSFNIAPVAELDGRRGQVKVTIVANCPAGSHIEMDVALEQGDVSTTGHAAGQCKNALAEYAVRMPAHGRDGFTPGSATAVATAVIRHNGEIVETQTWRRVITLQP